jgi:thiol-disulfide isomerase/thioredoxin
MTRSKLLLLFVALLVSSCLAQNQSGVPPASLAGRWDAVITNASKIDVPFGLNVLQDRSAAGRMHASIVNGSEAIPFTSSEWDGTNLKLHLEQYDGVLAVRLNGADLTGDWTRQTSKGVRRYAFSARRHKQEVQQRGKWDRPSLDGEWVFQFSGTTGPDRVAPARFEQRTGVLHLEGDEAVADVEGTIAPVSGDYGLLAGSIRSKKNEAPEFQLSRFDGIHIVLLSGEFQPDGSIKGKLNTEEFTATRRLKATATSEEAEPDPETVTKVKDPDERFRFSAIDPKTGERVTQDDPRFKGKPYIVDIFGTWCPNCHDEAPLLTDLYNRYHGQGLEIVGLAYEYVDEPARNARVLDIYRNKYGVEFPLLMAGTTDEGQIAKTLPQLVGFGAYPTTIFVGADGRVQKIHAGFAGPATGDRFTEVKKRLEVNTRELLKTAPDNP